MLETRLIGCGMVILATAVAVVAAGPGIRRDAAEPTPSSLTMPPCYVKGWSEWDGARRDLAEDGKPTWGTRIATGSSEEVAPCPWTTVGAVSVERGMPVRFRGPSTNWLGRITVVFVRSRSSRPLGPSRGTRARMANRATDLPSTAAAFDREVAYVTTHGTDCFVWWVGPHEEVAVCPRVTCARGASNWMVRNTLSPDEDDLSGSGVCRRLGPGAFVCPPARDVTRTRAGSNGSCWLFGGGFLGGFSAHLKTRLS